MAVPGVNLAVKNSNGDTPLHLAANKGKWCRHHHQPQYLRYQRWKTQNSWNYYRAIFLEPVLLLGVFCANFGGKMFIGAYIYFLPCLIAITIIFIWWYLMICSRQDRSDVTVVESTRANGPNDQEQRRKDGRAGGEVFVNQKFFSLATK